MAGRVVKDGESGDSELARSIDGKLRETTAMGGSKVSKFVKRHRRWAGFLGLNLLVFLFWMRGSTLMTQSDIVDGKSALKMTFMAKPMAIENLHLKQNRLSDRSRLPELLRCDDDGYRNDPHFCRDHKSLILLLLIEAMQQNRGRP